MSSIYSYFNDDKRVLRKRMKNICYASTNQKKAGVTILMSDNIDQGMLSQTKERHYIMIKGSVLQEDITTSNIYTSIVILQIT